MSSTTLEQRAADTDAPRRRALRLYDLALGDQRWWPGAVLAELGWSAGDLQSAVDVLSSLALLVPAADTPSGWAAVPIDRARRHLLAQADAHVAAALGATRSVYEATLALSGTFQAVYADHLGDPDGQPVSGAGEVCALLDHAARGATASLATLHPAARSPDGDHRQAGRAQAACERGVATRMIQLASVRGAPDRLSLLQRLASVGVSVRTSHALPFELLVADRATAVVVVDRPGGAAAPAAVITRNQPMVTVLQQLFEHYWSASAVLDDPHRPGDEPWTGGRHRELLAMLAAGLTDEAIARKLGVSERTIRRLIAELSLRVSAVSRFQAGVNVTRLGWLDG